jgi:hypothetical protein
MVGRTSALAVLVATGIGLSGCNGHSGADGRPGYAADWYGPRPYLGDYGYQGRDYDYGSVRPAANLFRGPGASLLDPWLAFTSEGGDLVRRGFQTDEGWIGEEAAHRANIWFRRYADTDSDLALTDAEIRVALAQAEIDGRY